jgi:hypothetical protein
MKQLLTTTAMAVMISLSLYGLFSFKAKSNETTVYEVPTVFYSRVGSVRWYG